LSWPVGKVIEHSTTAATAITTRSAASPAASAAPLRWASRSGHRRL
jgi:hypothetical protein